MIEEPQQWAALGPLGLSNQENKNLRLYWLLLTSLPHWHTRPRCRRASEHVHVLWQFYLGPVLFYWYFKAGSSLYVPPHVILQNSPFCQHSLFVRLLWFSQWKPIVCRNITLWDLLMETKCILSDVGSEFVCVRICLNFWLRRFAAPRLKLQGVDKVLLQLQTQWSVSKLHIPIEVNDNKINNYYYHHHHHPLSLLHNSLAFPKRGRVRWPSISYPMFCRKLSNYKAYINLLKPKTYIMYQQL